MDIELLFLDALASLDTGFLLTLVPAKLVSR